MQKWNVLSKLEKREDIVNLLLKNRGIVTKEQKEEFLNPPTISEHLKNLDVGFKESLKKAKNIIEKTIKDGKQIVIFGDYDSDGINATAILYSTLKDELKYRNTDYFIPNRFDHGYGLSIGALKEIFSKYKKNMLIITVDTGITANEEIDFIKTNGHLVIVTDHHQKPDKPPKADCIVWSDKLVGSGVAWFLSRVIGSTNSQTISLAALATITDLYPVMGINRTIVKRGLEILNTNPPIGLRKLLQVAGKEIGNISTYELGWVLGPRLNASGRLVNADDSLRLLIEIDEKLVEEYAVKLNQTNIERQDKTLEMYDLASGLDEKNLPKIIFSINSNYHEGIIGLVAAKLSQKYYRPAVVVSLSDGFGKGSVRSVKGVDIIKFLRRFEDLFEDLGGHPMAAGFSIQKENISVLEEKLIKEAEEQIKDEDLIPVLEIDLKIPIDFVDLKLLESIEVLKPFGLGNNEPLFVSENIPISDFNVVGRDGKHLSVKFYKDDVYYKGIMFNGAERQKELEVGSKLDIVYSLSKNEYNGKKYIDLIIKDFRK